MTEEKAITDLTKIKGLNKKSAIRLYRAGINSIKRLGSSNPEELSKITGIAKKQLTTWVILARAQERKKFVEVDSAAAELSQLVEIKIEDAKRLVSSGVMSIEDLAEESADLLSEDTGLSVDVIDKWIRKAKEVKKLPPERRKVVVVPTVEATFGSKLSGGLFGSSSGLNNIYNDTSSFGQSLIFVILFAVLFSFYLSMSQADIMGWALTDLWAMAQLTLLSIEFPVGTMVITMYPLVMMLGTVLIIVIWLVLGKILASARKLEFKNTSAVLGFGLAPGIFMGLVIVGKFLPALHDIILANVSGMDLYLVSILLIIFGVWAGIMFIRGMIFSPQVQPTTIIPPEAPKFAAATSPAPTSSVELVADEATAHIPFTKPPMPTTQPVSAAPPTAKMPLSKPSPVKIENYGIINQNEVATLHNAGFYTSTDLLRANSKDISGRTGIPQSKIIIWRIISDLLRIPNMNIQNAMILAKSGVRSVKHLSKINVNALRVQVLDTISKEGIPTSITANMLSEWISLSKSI